MAESYEAKVRDLEADIRSKVQWAQEVEAALTVEIKKQTADLEKQTAELVKAVEALHHTEKELDERTAWALRLDKEASELARQLDLYRGSRWVKLGRKVGLGPGLPAS
jgi:hypothetical protein